MIKFKQKCTDQDEKRQRAKSRGEFEPGLGEDPKTGRGLFLFEGKNGEKCEPQIILFSLQKN